jgi:biopolymer transport protein TolQ
MNAHAAPSSGLGVLDLVVNSGPVAQAVLLLLLGASVLCWGIIFSKWKVLKRATSEDLQFVDAFWHSSSVDDCFAKSEKFASSPIASVFRSGYKEIRKHEHKPAPLQVLERALQRSVVAETTSLEKSVSWLATTASAAPFIGLFGTVWGIMNSFQNIGASGSASLSIVAPGISEALITTATGIAAAVPAVVAYNVFVNRIRKRAVEMECFSQDFLNLVQRGQ